jgi:hypothetical protein
MDAGCAFPELAAPQESEKTIRKDKIGLIIF